MTELRLHEPSTDEWVRSNIKIPQVDSTDGTTGQPNSGPTNAFGEIHFSGATRKSRAQYVRLSQDTQPEIMRTLLVDKWGMEDPKLLISVTGGAKSFSMDPSLRQQFAQGLLKVAETPGAWIITGGTNAGVMKYVGEALQGATKACIGIATWGIVGKREDLVEDARKVIGDKFTYQVASSLVERGAFLDHNHTHFLLADDGTVGKYGVDIALRANLEAELVRRNVPSVLLVLEGGPGTLGTVQGSLEGGVPVVIIKDTGRAADLLVEAMGKCSAEKAASLAENLDNPDPEIMAMVESMFPGNRKLYKVLLSCLKKMEMITTFHMDSSSTVDEAILAALLKRHSSTHMEQLKFTLLWDRPDLADENILSKPLRNGEEWKHDELAEAMIIALATNRVDFVKLFLKYGISLSKIVDENILQFLYGFCMRCQNSILDREVKENVINPITRETEQTENIRNVMQRLCADKGYEFERCGITMQLAHGLIEDLCASLRQGKNILEKIEVEQCPFRELFFWAVLNGMHEMAMFLWEFEEEGLMKALIAAEINNQLAKKAARLTNLQDEVQEKFESNAKDFQKLAMQLLEECYKTDESKAQKLITGQSVQFNNHRCLDVAVNSDHKEFVSHSSVQALLDDVWTGSLKDTDISTKDFLISMVFPPYITKFNFRTESELKDMIQTDEVPALPLMAAATKTDNINNETPSERNSSQTYLVTSSSAKSYNTYQADGSQGSQDGSQHEEQMSFCKKLALFHFKTPVIKFYMNLVAYLVFLGLISFVAMRKKTAELAHAEYAVLVFVISFTVEEIHQLLQSEFSSVSAKLEDYFSSKWNIMDLLAIVLYYVALGLRLNSSTHHIGHLFYAFDAGIWILRMLHVFYAHRIMGPYVVMIYRMFIDMLYFLTILVVFMIAYGVVSVSILQPQKSSIKMLSDVVFHPYFNIYGELFLDRDPEDDTSTRFGTPILNDYTETLCIVLLGLYLLIANVLLLNIVIAIFGNTFTEVQENSSQIWKFQRYPLILEYSDRPPLVPPFILLAHLYLFCRWIWRVCTSEAPPSSGLNARLTPQEREEINEFESDCVANYLRTSVKDGTSDQGNVSDVLDKVKSLQKVISGLEKRLQQTEKFQLEV